MSDKRFGSTGATVHLCPDESQYPEAEEMVRSVAAQATCCGGKSALIVDADDDEHENGKQINELTGGSDEEHEVYTLEMDKKQVVKKDLLCWVNGNNGFAVDGVLTGHQFAARLDRSVATGEAAVKCNENLVRFIECWKRSDGNATQSSGPEQTHCIELPLKLQNSTKCIHVGINWGFRLHFARLESLTVRGDCGVQEDLADSQRDVWGDVPQATPITLEIRPREYSVRKAFPPLGTEESRLVSGQDVVPAAVQRCRARSRYTLARETLQRGSPSLARVLKKGPHGDSDLQTAALQRPLCSVYPETHGTCDADKPVAAGAAKAEARAGTGEFRSADGVAVVPYTPRGGTPVVCPIHPIYPVTACTDEPKASLPCTKDAAPRPRRSVCVARGNCAVLGVCTSLPSGTSHEPPSIPAGSLRCGSDIPRVPLTASAYAMHAPVWCAHVDATTAFIMVTAILPTTYTSQVLPLIFTVWRCPVLPADLNSLKLLAPLMPVRGPSSATRCSEEQRSDQLDAGVAAATGAVESVASLRLELGDFESNVTIQVKSTTECMTLSAIL
jgi:hypothetical protein